MASNKYNLPGIRQEQRKSKPYTIKDIGNKEALESWRSLQLVKEQTWQEQKQLKLDLNIARLQQAQDQKLIYAGTHALLSPTKSYARYHGLIKDTKPKYNFHPKVETPQPWYIRLKDYILNWFLNIKQI